MKFKQLPRPLNISDQEADKARQLNRSIEYQGMSVYELVALIREKRSQLKLTDYT